MPSGEPGKIIFMGKIDPRLIPTDSAPRFEVVDRVMRRLPRFLLPKATVMRRMSRKRRSCLKGSGANLKSWPCGGNGQLFKFAPEPRGQN